MISMSKNKQIKVNYMCSIHFSLHYVFLKAFLAFAEKPEQQSREMKLDLLIVSSGNTGCSGCHHVFNVT